MEYFLTIGGERSGPCTQFQLIQRIREGALKGSELVWRKGAPEWQPLKSLEEFAPYWPLTEEQMAQAMEARRIARAALDTPQPWLRFWARMVDYTWFTMLLYLILGPFMPDPKALVDGNVQAQLISIGITCGTFLLFAPLEAWCLSRYGTTPGKALLRIQVRRREGGLPSFRQAMQRALLVYVKGIALGLSPPVLFTMSFARIKLLQLGMTTWDRDCSTRVEHGEPEVWRYLVLTGLIVMLAMVMMVAFTLLMRPHLMDALRSNLPK